MDWLTAINLLEQRSGEFRKQFGRWPADLSELVEKGLVFQIFQGKETLYHCVDPSKLLELLKEKEVAFQKILPRLEMIFQKKPPVNAAYIYKGLVSLP